VCSLDVQGTIRVWSTSPLCRTIAVFSSRPNTHIIEWVTHHERYLLAADTSNHLRLLDVREGHEMWEISFSETIRYVAYKIDRLELTCAPDRYTYTRNLTRTLASLLKKTMTSQKFHKSIKQSNSCFGCNTFIGVTRTMVIYKYK